jgi:hypothetical protein
MLQKKNVAGESATGTLWMDDAAKSGWVAFNALQHAGRNPDHQTSVRNRDPLNRES